MEKLLSVGIESDSELKKKHNTCQQQTIVDTMLLAEWTSLETHNRAFVDEFQACTCLWQDGEVERIF